MEKSERPPRINSFAPRRQTAPAATCWSTRFDRQRIHQSRNLPPVFGFACSPAARRPTFMMLPLFRPASHRVASARACATRLTKLAAACERRVRELKANEFEKINSRRAANELM